MRDVVLLADGVTEDADLSEAEIARRDTKRGSRVPGQESFRFRSIRLELRVPAAPTEQIGRRARPAEGSRIFALEPYDNVLIRRQAGWELQRLVYLTGQVKHPGRYALRSKTERMQRPDRARRRAHRSGIPGWIQFYRSYAPGHRPE